MEPVLGKVRENGKNQKRYQIKTDYQSEILLKPTFKEQNLRRDTLFIGHPCVQSNQKVPQHSKHRG